MKGSLEDRTVKCLSLPDHLQALSSLLAWLPTGSYFLAAPPGTGRRELRRLRPVKVRTSLLHPPSLPPSLLPACSFLSIRKKIHCFGVSCSKILERVCASSELKSRNRKILWRLILVCVLWGSEGKCLLEKAALHVEKYCRGFFFPFFFEFIVKCYCVTLQPATSLVRFLLRVLLYVVLCGDFIIPLFLFQSCEYILFCGKDLLCTKGRTQFYYVFCLFVAQGLTCCRLALAVAEDSWEERCQG